MSGYHVGATASASPTSATINSPTSRRRSPIRWSSLPGVDLLIHERISAQRVRPKANVGPSTVQYAAAVAAASGVKRLALFHHDPSHDDENRTDGDGPQACAAAHGIEVFAAVRHLDRARGR